jgi:tRNA uridine 5-carbamoylmethylation protein Kti12
LAFNIHRLAKEHIKTIKSIVFDGIDQNEFDLEQLSQKKLRELQRFIRNKIHEM